MRVNKLWLFVIAILVNACGTDEIPFLIKGEIKGAEGKYIKVIDMMSPGLLVDSIELDLAGRFEIKKVSQQPNDYVFYFNPMQSIRVTPLPEEQIHIKGKASNLVKTYTITGSPDSEIISKFLKKQLALLEQLDTVRNYYLENQLSPEIDSVVVNAQKASDSIFNKGKQHLINVITKNPGCMASYVALSQKLGNDLNFFTLQNDFKYFNMVDTAMQNVFDTAFVVRMLHGYVQRGKQQQKATKQKSNQLRIGCVAPEISLPNVYGDTIALSEFKGKYVLVDFWGSWCRPCRVENPKLRRAYRMFRKKGFEIYQVALERNKTDWKNTIREDKLYWRGQVSELNYMESKAAHSYQIKSVPSNFLLNTDGKIIAHNLYGDDLLAKLKEIFASKPTVVVTE